MPHHWESGKMVSGVWHQISGGDLNTWVRFAADDVGWYKVVGDNREDQLAMLQILLHARTSNRQVSVYVTTPLAAQVQGVSY